MPQPQLCSFLYIIGRFIYLNRDTLKMKKEKEAIEILLHSCVSFLFYPNSTLLTISLL